MTPAELRALGGAAEFPKTLHPILCALAIDAGGDWERAHRVVQDIESPEASWVHAYLHRKEGDLSNASYWYERAGRSRPSVALDAEWEAIASDLLPRLGI